MLSIHDNNQWNKEDLVLGPRSIRREGHDGPRTNQAGRDMVVRGPIRREGHDEVVGCSIGYLESVLLSESQWYNAAGYNKYVLVGAIMTCVCYHDLWVLS